MLQFLLMLVALISTPLSSLAQEGIGADQGFGPDGRLYYVAHSGTDVISYFLLDRHPTRGEDGFSYDGRIRIKTEVVGGGYAETATEYVSACSVIDQNPSVWFGSGDHQTEVNIDPNLLVPPRNALSAYNLWWAACKNEFQKFE